MFDRMASSFHLTSWLKLKLPVRVAGALFIALLLGGYIRNSRTETEAPIDIIATSDGGTNPDAGTPTAAGTPTYTCASPPCWIPTDVSQRFGHAMAFDGQNLVVFGGWDGNRLNDTWVWDSN